MTSLPVTLTVLAVGAAWRAWRLPVGFRALVPYYRVWRTGRALAALLLMAAAWSARVEGQT